MHIFFSGNTSVVDLEGNLMRGNLQRNKLRIIREWIKLHRDELETNWIMVRTNQLTKPIEPWRKL